MPTAREETTRLADLLRREHHALSEFLIALAAFDRERRWVELGYPSLFEFLRRELKLSAGAAQYRKTAAALIQEYRAVEAALRRGDLCLTSVVEVSRVITAENAAEILPRFFGKSARDAAFVAAALRPVENPPVREFLVTPVRTTVVEPSAIVPDGVFRAPEVDSTVAWPAAPLPLAATIAASAPAGVAASTGVAAPVPDRPRIRPLDAERARVNMTVSRRLLDKLAAARDALSHSHPAASEETILELGLDLIIERHRKRRGIGAKARKPKPAPQATAATKPSSSSSSSSSSRPSLSSSAPAPALARASAAPSSSLPAVPPPPSQRSRHVPAAVWRAVWERDQGRCVWPLDGGGACGSTRQLELDHIHGFALGAATTVDECRVLCRFHQDVSARRLYGDDTMNGFTRPKGGQCSEPVARYAPSPRSQRAWRGVGAPARRCCAPSAFRSRPGTRALAPRPVPP